MTTTSEHEIAKAVIKVAASTRSGIATFKRLYEEIPNHVTLSRYDLAPSVTRNGEPMWHQIVRNIKSHSETEGNAICEGLIEHVPRVGYKITNLGRQHL